MTKPFYSHIRIALADPTLQSALDGNAERRQRVYHQAFATLPDPQALRMQAHAVRAETISSLDGYLEQFVHRLQANGVIVHRAASAAQAAEIVVDIARQNGAQRVAKSKSMVSEEVGLNHALEAAGFEVVETDLGEYIIQLRGERPSHIITPAVHLRRGQVSQTFHEKLDVPLTEDIEEMTATARRQLRQVFLSAEVGVSGVNFGVAETGTLCIVTNEGNGRMVTTLPPVHVALMGIERLAPTLDDLALMLALLPRAATGQKITVYTTLMHAPRRPGDPEGPRQRHLILVDNGRSAVQASPLAEALLCIRCGACLNACPVFQEIGGHAYVDVKGNSSTYPGPIGSVVSPALFGQAGYGHLARASTLCGACREACPVDIDLPKLLLRTRAGGTELGRSKAVQGTPRKLAWGLQLYTWLATDSRRFGVAQRLAALAGRILSPRGSWMRLPAFTGWGRARLFPRPSSQPFREQFVAGGHPGDQGFGEPGGITAPAPTQVDARDGRSEVSGGAEPPGQDALMGRFAAELVALGGGFMRCGEGELAGTVLAWLRERHLDEVLAWETDCLPAGLIEALRDGGIQIQHTWDHTGETSVEGGEAPEGIPRVGLTGSLAAVAETGTLALVGGAGRPLIASLLPEVHLAVLRAADICENLPQVLRMQEVREAPMVALISGPSRTADIEMTLTIGVHGPKEVWVFCVV